MAPSRPRRAAHDARARVAATGTVYTFAYTDRGTAAELVPTSEETRRQLGLVMHQLSRVESEAWFAADEHDHAEARRAIREAVREQGGGELRDHRGRLLERIEA